LAFDRQKASGSVEAKDAWASKHGLAGGRAPGKHGLPGWGRNDMSTAVKLVIAACVVSGVTAWMACVGSTSSWQYYLTVDECLADDPALMKQPLRVSGRIEAGSLQISGDPAQATFQLAGTVRHLPVSCAGPLPDNLAEGIDVVVEGRLDDTGMLCGEKVLTRCASKYTPATRIATGTSPEDSREDRRR
jgi:cytochrome c-type biogenesis protein CcmE